MAQVYFPPAACLMVRKRHDDSCSGAGSFRSTFPDLWLLAFGKVCPRKPGLRAWRRAPFNPRISLLRCNLALPSTRRKVLTALQQALVSSAAKDLEMMYIQFYPSKKTRSKHEDSPGPLHEHPCPNSCADAAAESRADDRRSSPVSMRAKPKNELGQDLRLNKLNIISIANSMHVSVPSKSPKSHKNPIDCS